jgi:tRNA-splicing ligase RtcB
MDRTPFPGTFERLDEYRWILPASYMPGMRVPGIIVASRTLLENARADQTPQQVANVAMLPGIVGASLAMPDLHWGYGFPVGGVAAFDLDEGVISPGGIGYDINCGIRLIRSGHRAADLEGKLAPLMDAIFARVPSGVGATGEIRLGEDDQRSVCRKGARWSVEQGWGWTEDLAVTEDGGSMPGADFDEVSDRARERGKRQLGTLGSGNHFIEVQVVDEVYDEAAARALGLFKDQVTVMIHSGSRGFGYQVCDDFLAVMGKALGKHHLDIPDRQLACAPVKSEEGRRYLGAMNAAANWAWANRQAMTHRVREAFEHVLGAAARRQGLFLVNDNCHNIARIEEHTVDGKSMKLCVHRKGATRSFPAGHPDIPEPYRTLGQPVLLPGDMGRFSYVLVGAPGSMEKTFGSTSHGAGRRMSRTAAVKAARGRRIDHELEARGIIVRAHDLRSLAEEMPDAYKDASDVVDVVHGAGLSRKVAKLRPLGVVKG